MGRKNKKILSFLFLAIFVVAFFNVQVSGYGAKLMPEFRMNLAQADMMPGADEGGSDASGESSAVLDKVINTAKSAGMLALSALLWKELLAINGALYLVFMAVNIIGMIAGMIFDWAINPVNFTTVVGSQAVKDGWMVVRDLLNLSFILVLLYSAFCTVFQIEKFHIKKIILMVVLMALLVNFSYPIALFIIDTANVALYFFVGKAFPSLSNTSGLSASVANIARVGWSASPDIGDYATVNQFMPIVKLILSILFMFIFTITMLIIAALLIIRIVVLAIVVIFAPIGFVGLIFPALNKYADDWWTALFKQSFYAPIQMFFVYFAIRMMQELNSGGVVEKIKANVTNAISENAYSDIIVNGVYMTIPIALMWTGMVMGQKMGAIGANEISSYGKKYGKQLLGSNFAKKWGGKAITGAGGLVSKIKGPSLLGMAGGALAGRGGRLGAIGKSMQGAAATGVGGVISNYGQNMAYTGTMGQAKAATEQERQFERGTREYEEQIKDEKADELHQKMNDLLKIKNRSALQNMELAAITNKLRNDGDLDDKKITTTVTDSAGNVLSGAEALAHELNGMKTANGKAVGQDHAMKLITHMPGLATTAHGQKIIAAATGDTTVVGNSAKAMAVVAGKIKGAKGAQNLSLQGLQSINATATDSEKEEFIKNLDASVIGNLNKDFKVEEVDQLKQLLDVYIANNGGSRSMTTIASHPTATPQIKQLMAVAGGNNQLKSALGLT